MRRVSNLLHVIGRRGCSLLFFAFLDFVYAASLIDPPAQVRNTAMFQFIARVAPLWLWALLWGGVGLVCLVCAFRRSDKVGFAAAIAIKTLWGSIAMLAGFVGVERAYVSGTIWLAMAGWVAIISGWPEPPKVVDVPTPAPKPHRAP